jgi:hypothetical protein
LLDLGAAPGHDVLQHAGAIACRDVCHMHDSADRFGRGNPDAFGREHRRRLARQRFDEASIRHVEHFGVAHAEYRRHRIETDIGEQLAQPCGTDVARNAHVEAGLPQILRKNGKPGRKKRPACGHRNDPLAVAVGGRRGHALRHGVDQSVLQRDNALGLHPRSGPQSRSGVIGLHQDDDPVGLWNIGRSAADERGWHDAR